MVKLFKPFVRNIAVRLGTAGSAFLIGQGVSQDQAVAVETGLVVGLLLCYDFLAQFIADNKKGRI